MPKAAFRNRQDFSKISDNPQYLNGHLKRANPVIPIHEKITGFVFLRACFDFCKAPPAV